MHAPKWRMLEIQLEVLRGRGAHIWILYHKLGVKLNDPYGYRDTLWSHKRSRFSNERKECSGNFPMIIAGRKPSQYPHVQLSCPILSTTLRQCYSMPCPKGEKCQNQYHKACKCLNKSTVRMRKLYWINFSLIWNVERCKEKRETALSKVFIWSPLLNHLNSLQSLMYLC